MQGVSHFLGFFIFATPCIVTIYDSVSVNFGDGAISWALQAVKSLLCLSKEDFKFPCTLSVPAPGQSLLPEPASSEALMCKAHEYREYEENRSYTKRIEETGYYSLFPEYSVCIFQAVNSPPGHCRILRHRAFGDDGFPCAGRSPGRRSIFLRGLQPARGGRFSSFDQGLPQ